MGEHLMRVSEVAEVLSLKPSTIRKLLHQRRIPKVKLGRAVRVREGDVLALIRLGYESAWREDGRE